MNESPGDLQLWLVDPRPALDEQVRDRLAELLSSDERDRAARFSSVDDQASYITAHALARVMLGELIEREPRELRFETNEYGKPRVARTDGSNEIGFSLSHTRGLVACAACFGADIGVDVEAEREPPMDVARQYFAAPECAALDAAPADARPDLFFTLWTLKESVLKAVGTGLSTELNTFACAASPPSLLPVGEFAASADQWHLWHQRVGPAHHVAVAVHLDRSTRPSLRMEEITGDDLLKRLRDPRR